jgi:hypothetical protein
MAASSSVLGLTMLAASQPGPTKPAPQLPLANGSGVGVGVVGHVGRRGMVEGGHLESKV